MSKKNELVIEKNGNYKNLDLMQMGNGDVITITKQYDETKRTEKPSKFNTSEMWVSVTASVNYNGEDDVKFFMPKGYNEEGNYIDAEAYANIYDGLGGRDTQLSITCKKGIVNVKTKKAPKGEDKVFQEFVFEKVE